MLNNQLRSRPFVKVLGYIPANNKETKNS